MASYNPTPPGALSQTESRIVAIGWTHVRYWGWQLLTKIILGVVYFGIVSEGSRRLVPSLGQKLYKLAPLMERVNHRLDGAHCFALFILVGCWCSWTWLLQMWLGIKWYSREYKIIIIPLAIAFIIVDIVMFYFAVAQWRWGGALFSYSAMLATAGYLAVLIFVTFVGIILKEEIRKD
jgi:hypothetical protein